MARNQVVLEAAFKVFSKFGYKKASMSDIAQSAGISRPTLYALYPDKESVFSALIEQTIEQNISETSRRIEGVKDLDSKLRHVLDVWIIEPYSAAMETENGSEMVLGASLYAPVAMNRLWKEFEREVASVLELGMRKNGVSAKELAIIFVSSCRDFKASAKSVRELKKSTEILLSLANSL